MVKGLMKMWLEKCIRKRSYCSLNHLENEFFPSGLVIQVIDSYDVIIRYNGEANLWVKDTN